MQVLFCIDCARGDGDRAPLLKSCFFVDMVSSQRHSSQSAARFQGHGYRTTGLLCADDHIVRGWHSYDTMSRLPVRSISIALMIRADTIQQDYGGCEVEMIRCRACAKRLIDLVVALMR